MAKTNTKQPLHQDIADPWANYRESEAPSTCGARGKRTGKPCGRRDLCASGRCRLHGGLSTGPKTPEGLARSAANGRLGGRPRKVLQETEVLGNVKVTSRVGGFPDMSGESGNLTKLDVSNSMDVERPVGVKRAMVSEVTGQSETKPLEQPSKAHFDQRRNAWLAIARSKGMTVAPAVTVPAPTGKVHVLPVLRVPTSPYRG